MLLLEELLVSRRFLEREMASEREKERLLDRTRKRT